MPTGSSVVAAPRQIPTAALAPFLLMTFGLAWSVLALFMFLPGPMEHLFGELSGSHPLFFLAVYAPAIAAIVIVGFIGGAAGLRRFLSRALLWRAPAGWYALLIVGIPLLFVVGSAIKGNLLTDPAPLTRSLLTAMVLMLILGPVEEFGWRGVALPLLQRRLAPIWAGLVIGLIWALWHLPAFFLSGTPQGAWGFMPFFIATVSASIILTPLFNVSGGSILLAAVFHYQLSNPLWPDAQPYDTISFACAAVIVVWLNRRTMFCKEHAVTEVIPGTTT